MRIKTGLVFILSVFILLGSSKVSVGASENSAPDQNNTPASVITAGPENVAYQQTILAEIVRENGSETKVINGPVLVLDEEGCVYGPADKAAPVEITKDIKVTADNAALADIVLNGNLYIYADNVVLSRLVIKGTIYISPGKALKLDQITSDNVEVIIPEELEASQPQDAQAAPDTLPAEDEQVSVDTDTATAADTPDALPAEDEQVSLDTDTAAVADTPAALAPAEANSQAVIDTPVIPDDQAAQHIPAETRQSPNASSTQSTTDLQTIQTESSDHDAQGLPVASQPQGLSQAPEITIEAQSPEKPKAIRGYLEATSINDASSLIVVVNKDRSLPASWKPNDLVMLQVPYKGRAEARYMRKEASEALTELFAKAKSEGIELYAVSGYRSYNLQTTVFTKYTNMLGVLLAQRVSAKPGQSEHQTGLAVDISSRAMNYNLYESFSKSQEGKWLAENAAEFGFILRYPKDREAVTGYKYEPWHFRYVGRDVAADITAKGLTLEEYFNLLNEEIS